MVKTEEGEFRVADDKALYTKSWLPDNPPIAIIIFLHGFSDHCNRYGPFFEALVTAGIAIHTFDQRGAGRSAINKSEWGVTGPRSQFLRELTSFISSKLPAEASLFLMGQSMGGQNTLFFASRGPEDVRRQITGYIAMAPWIQLPIQPGWLKLNLGRAALRFLPHFKLENKFDSRWMSHDTAFNKSWEDDALCHDNGTLEMLGGCLDVADELHTGKMMIEDGENVHLFLSHGTDDHVTSYPATKAFAERCQVKDKELKVYDNAYHCGKSLQFQYEVHANSTVYSEPEHKEKLIADILDFIRTRLPTRNTEAVGTSKL